MHFYLQFFSIFDLLSTYRDRNIFEYKTIIELIGSIGAFEAHLMRLRIVKNIKDTFQMWFNCWIQMVSSDDLDFTSDLCSIQPALHLIGMQAWTHGEKTAYHYLSIMLLDTTFLITIKINSGVRKIENAQGNSWILKMRGKLSTLNAFFL